MWSPSRHQLYDLGKSILRPFMRSSASSFGRILTVWEYRQWVLRQGSCEDVKSCLALRFLQPKRAAKTANTGRDPTAVRVRKWKALTRAEVETLFAELLKPLPLPALPTAGAAIPKNS